MVSLASLGKADWTIRLR